MTPTPPTKGQSILFFVVFPIGALIFLAIYLLVPSASPRLGFSAFGLGLISVAMLVMRLTAWRGGGR